MLFDYLTSEQRARLISKRIAFIIPNVQTYLPFIFLDFRKEVSKAEIKNVDTFTPSNQLIFLYIFYSNREVLYAKDIEKQCKVSAMTVNRTLKLLTKLKIIQKNGSKSGTRYEVIKSKKEMFHTVKHLLFNPLRFTIYVEEMSLRGRKLAAGEFALEQLGMLSYKKMEQYAIGSDLFKEIKRNDFYLEDLDSENHYVYSKDLKIIALQVWMYNPELIRNDLQVDLTNILYRNVVDGLSLYLSLVDIDDDRIQIDLENLLNRVLEEPYDTGYTGI